MENQIYLLEALKKRTIFWKKTLFLLLIFAFTSTLSFSQIEWRRAYFAIDSTGWIYNSALKTQQFRDGYMYFTGTIHDSLMNEYGGLSKVDHLGAIVWSKKFPVNSRFIDFKIVDSTKLLILGSYADTNSNHGAILIKTDSSGSILWKYKYTNNISDYADPTAVLASRNADTVECYTWAGTVDSGRKVILMKVNKNNGDTIKSKLFNLKIGSNGYILRDLIQTTDGNYVVCGVFKNNIADSAFVAKIANNLDSVVWFKSISFANYDGGEANSVVEIDSSGIKTLYCLGVVNKLLPPLTSTFIMRISANADTTRWARLIDNISGKKLSSGINQNVYFVAVWGSNTTGVLASISKNGATMNFMKVYPYLYSPYNVNDIITTKDGGFAITGLRRYSPTFSNSVVDIIKTDVSGNIPIVASGSPCSVITSYTTPFNYIETVNLYSAQSSVTSNNYKSNFTGSFNTYLTAAQACSTVCYTSNYYTLTGKNPNCGAVTLKDSGLLSYNYYRWVLLDAPYDTVITYEDTFQATKSGRWWLHYPFMHPTCYGSPVNVWKTVNVYPNPKAGFDTTYTTCFNYVQFNDTSTIDSTSKIVLRLWSFDHPSFSADSIAVGKDVYFKYPDTGNYIVRLVAFTDKYCTDTAFVNLRIDTVSPNPPLQINSASSTWDPLTTNTIHAVINVPPLTQYSFYTWYRNGAKLTGPCTCPNYTATTPGEYRVEAVGDCGLEVSNTLTLTACVPDNYLQTFAFGGRPKSIFYDNDSGYFIGNNQAITILKDSIVTFKNTTLLMDSCSEIKINAGGKLILRNVNIISCSNWKGIVVNGNSGAAQSASTHGTLIMDSCYLTGAAIGVYSKDGGIIEFKQDTFENNFVHVGVGPYYSYTHASWIDSCQFGQIKPYEYFDSIACKPSWWSEPPYYVALSGDTNRFQPAVYLDSINTFSFTENDYPFNRFYNPLSTTSVVDFENRKAGLLAYDVRNLMVQNSGFYGPYQHGLQLKKVYGTNTNNIIINWFDAFAGVPYSNVMVTGAYIEETENMNIEGNELIGLPRGIEYYNHGNSLADTIRGGRFRSNSIGLIISPEEMPVTLDSVNMDTATIKLQVHCNEFKYNGFAIVGSGNIVDQQKGFLDTNADVGNLFISNKEWDLIWQDFDTSYFSYFNVAISYVDSANGNSWLLRNPLILNGVSQNVPDFIQIFNTTSASGGTGDIIPNSCRAFFFKANPNIINSVGHQNQPDDRVKVYPNPFNGQIYVKFEKEIGNGTIELYDIMGRIVLSKPVSSQEIELATQGLLPGFYILLIRNGKEVVHTEKLIRTQD